MPRPRFTLRWLMVAVAIAGLVCGGEALRRRRAHCLKQASFCAARELEEAYEAESFRWLTAAGQQQTQLKKEFGLPESTIKLAHENDRLTQEIAERRRASAAHWGLLKRRYQRAARYPWLPVAPDPPEPE